MNCVFILQLVEIGDADVIPAHPVLIVVGARSGGRVIAEAPGAALGSNFNHRIGGMIAAQNIIDVTLPKVAVFNGRCHCDRAFDVRRNVELIADQSGTSRLDRVVIGHGMDGPHLVVINEVSS